MYSEMRKIFIKIRDRIGRLGGVRRISIDTILPIVILPLMLAFAAINFSFMIIICIVMPIFLGYAQWLRKSYAPRTKFFFMWSLWSGIYLWMIFETTVPLTELLPEENFIFRTLLFAAAICFYWTRQRAIDNYVAPKTDNIDNMCETDHTRLLMDIEEVNENQEDSNDNSETDSDLCDFVISKTNNNICSKCRRYIPPRAFHCKICQKCIAKRDHHSVWLDCCIGESNYKFFLIGCFLAMFALLFGANLSLTSICHPFFVFRIFNIDVLLPDDCSDVFGQYDMAICFVGSIYATVIALCCFIILIQQCYLILKGVTASELSRGDINRNGCIENSNRKKRTFFSDNSVDYL